MTQSVILKVINNPRTVFKLILVLDKNIALIKSRSKNKFSVDFRLNNMFHQKETIGFCRAVQYRYNLRCINLALPDSIWLDGTFLFALSQLEPQINLKSNLLSFVIKVCGIISGKSDALYIICDIVKLLLH